MKYLSKVTKFFFSTNFGPVKQGLVPLIEKVKQKPEPDMSFLKHKFDVQTQTKFNQQLAKDLGFDTVRSIRISNLLTL